MPKPPRLDHGTPKKDADDMRAVQPAKGRAVSTATTMSQYEEAQNDEIEALQSIFMDDFKHLESKGAWSKKMEKSFMIRLRVSSEVSAPETIEAKACLYVTLTATYPKTVPLLSVKGCDNVLNKTLDKMNDVLVWKPKELLQHGMVMVLEIANEVERVMRDAVDAQAQGLSIPSLEEERAAHEAKANTVAREEAEIAIKRQQEEKDEEDRMMQRMLEKEMQRQDDLRVKRAISETNGDNLRVTGKGDLCFDQNISISVDHGKDLVFREISFQKILYTSPFSTIYEAFPIDTQHAGSASNSGRQRRASFALRRARIVKCQVKKSILDLEDNLEKLKSLRHSAIINVYDFKIGKEGDSWQFDILTEISSRGPLSAMLQTFGSLPLPRARSCAIELLEALDFIHKNGITHGSVNLNNVLLCEIQSKIVFKLSDAAIQHGLRIIGEKSHAASTGPHLTSPWQSPESAENSLSKNRKSDVWDFGVLLVQIFLGLDICEQYSTPMSFMNTFNLTEPFQDLLKHIFHYDTKRRASAFDIMPCEFLRTDAAVVLDPMPTDKGLFRSRPHSNYQQSSSLDTTTKGLSRFVTEFDETGHIGKGGFGEVVKARNKLDGRIYAVKKITSKTQTQLTEVLSEARHLAILNHPFVVRYFQVWLEDDFEPISSEGSELTSTSDLKDSKLQDRGSSFDVGHSTGGLDFISSSGYPKIEFELDDDDDEADSDIGDENDNITNSSGNDQKSNLQIDDQRKEAFQRRKGDSKSLPAPLRPITKSTLFIQMEYCERRTLRGLINKGIYDHTNEVWRLLRQILEGLVHIHSFGMIHRDLKPENIFLDLSNNPKIGDLGLATVGQHSALQNPLNPRAGESVKSAGDDMTRDIGTALYVAPELRSSVSGMYTEKVDMYSLGIIFFEMCHPLKTGMERGEILGALRSEKHKLPEEFNDSAKQTQGSIIESLVRHKPSERPTSAGLLHSDILPLRVEDEQMRSALQRISDPSSPEHHTMMSAMFSQVSNQQIMDKVWDMDDHNRASSSSTDYFLLQTLTEDKLASVFRRHGAVKTSRQGLIPRSSYYTSSNVAEFLDRSGALRQLPFDLTLPFARKIARQVHVAEKSYAFGMVFREASTGAAPRSIQEADFDIVSYDTRDLALKEAEVVKVLDEILDEFPAFNNTPMCFHISHSTVIDIILEYCRVTPTQRQATKEVLGKLNIHPWTWQKIRAELRSPAIGVSLTSLDELAQFDFRDTVEKAFARLQSIFLGTPHLETLHSVFTHISGLDEYLKLYRIRRKVFFCPLASFSDKFYQGNIMIQLLYNNTKKRDVLAAGGRYDHLIEDHRPRLTGSVSSTYQPTCHAVGVNIAWDRLVSSMVRHQKQSGSQFLKKPSESEMVGTWASRRCDVLVASFDSAVLRSVGCKMLGDLWAHDISAELAVDARSPEQLLAQYRDDRHSWILIIKHEAYASGKPDLKVKNMDTKEETDIHSAGLINHLRGEIRERDQREGSNERAKLIRGPSRSDGSGAAASGIGKKGPVQVLMASHKSKKANKWRVVEAAHAKAQELVASFTDGPIASVETRDEVLDLIRETRLSDVESWRRITREVTPSEREYVWQIHEVLDRFKMQYRDTNQICFVYNFRTGKCIYYDMLL